jgi:hypothetical protein
MLCGSYPRERARICCRLPTHALPCGRRCRRLRLHKNIVPRKMTLILDLDETLVHSRCAAAPLLAPAAPGHFRCALITDARASYWSQR